MEKISIKIPVPCHENWDKMSATQQGRFCNSCEKQVVDFTLMSDGQVLKYLESQKAGTTCGRVYDNQLNRDMELPKFQPKKSKKIWHLFTLFLLFFSKSSEVKAQNKSGKTVQTAPQHRPEIMGDMIAVTIRKISGVIKDSNGKPISNAVVSAEEGANKSVTDVYGVFVLSVYNTTTSVLVNANGFEGKSLAISEKKFYTVQMKTAARPPQIIMGKMIAPARIKN